MPPQPLISIIVPVFNVENILERCVNSIVNQTLSDFELILVNDGSSDKSGVICDEYASKDNRIKVIHKKNGGASSARNAGLIAATGQYIGWVDSDDYIKENMYESLYKLARKFNADIVESKYYTETGGSFFKEETDESVIVGLDDFVLHEFFKGRMKPNLFTKLYKREIWKGVKFPIARNHQDCYVNILFSLRKINYVRTSEAFYIHVPKENSITTTISERAIREAIHLYDFENKLAKEDTISNAAKKYIKYDAVNRLLQRFFYIVNKASLNNQRIYNKIIIRKMGVQFILYMFSNKVVLKTRISYLLMLMNLMNVQTRIKQIIGDR